MEDALGVSRRRSYVAQLAKVRYADIGEREKRLILAENATRLFGLREWVPA